MVDPLDAVVASLEAVLDVLVGTFGPFLVPAAVFLAGLIGYGVLLALNRRRGAGPSEPSTRPTTETTDSARAPDGEQ